MTGSREGKVPRTDEGVKKIGASDPIFSPLEGTDFSRRRREKSGRGIPERTSCFLSPAGGSEGRFGEDAKKYFSPTA
jgi:hypothetical protein